MTDPKVIGWGIVEQRGVPTQLNPQGILWVQPVLLHDDGTFRQCGVARDINRASAENTARTAFYKTKTL